MSYDIMYNTQFIKTAHGITPCILSGCNNVTECKRDASGRPYERRERNWSVFGNMLDVSAKELTEYAQSFVGGAYQEHWMQNGKWIDDAALMRWVKHNTQTAAALDDIMAENNLGSVRCYISAWQNGDNVILLNKNVHSSLELDDWLFDAIKVCADVKAQNGDAFPKIDFYKEDIHFSGKPEKAIIREYDGYYVSEIKKVNDHFLWQTSKGLSSALIMPYEMALQVLHQCCRNGKILPAPKAPSKEKRYTIQVHRNRGNTDHLFVLTCSKHKVSYCLNAKVAKHYASRASAEKTAARLNEKFPNNQYVVFEEC